MANQYHGHEVIQMVATSGRSYTRESLRAAIIERFGGDATFYSCSQAGMSPDEMIDFMKARGKFIEGGDDLTFNQARACNHDH
jgi:probable metal-binding protein